MKIVELIHRTARRARTGDFTQLELVEKMDVLQAVNSALQEVYNVLPIYFKELTVGFLLPAPTTVSCDCTQYTNILGNSPFTTNQIGQTVVIAGDSAWTQITDVNKVLNPFMGPSGTQSATIYGDSLFSTRYPFDRIVGNPRFADQSQLAIIKRNLSNAGPPYLGSLTPSIGRPNNWWVQPFGNSQGNEPMLFIRFFPLPDIAYAVNVDLAFWPKRIELADYLANVTISVPDQFLDACLIPLAQRAMMTTPAYITKGDENLLLASAERGEAFLKNQVGQVAAPNNQVLTPIGY